MNRLISLFILCFACSQAHGHAGKTDASGGHHDRKNGGYHFHIGGTGGSSSSSIGSKSDTSSGLATQPKSEPRTSVRTTGRTDYRTEPRTPERIDPQKLEYKILVCKVFGKKSYCRVKVTNQDAPNPTSLEAISQEVFPNRVSWVFVFPKAGDDLLGVVIKASGKEPAWRAADATGSNVAKDPWGKDGRFANRLWHDAKGTHSIEAAFESRGGKTVKLIRPSNEPIEVEYEKLSDADHKWIEASTHMLP